MFVCTLMEEGHLIFMRLSGFYWLRIYLHISGELSVLVLLVFSNQIVEMVLRLHELHLIHSVASIARKECLTTVQSSELLAEPLPHLFNCC